MRRWRDLPPAARWVAAYAVALGGSAGLGALTPLGVGNAIFLAGVAAIFVSLSYVRLGGPRTRVGRDVDGRPLWGLDPEARRGELRRGIAIFLLGLALWAAIGVMLLAAR